MLYDDPPVSHAFSLYTVANDNSASGGQVQTRTLVQAGARGSINTVDARTRLLYAQQQIVVTDIIGILSEYLTTTPKRGMQVVSDNTGEVLIIKGIRIGRVSLAETIPQLTYLDCELYLE